MLLTRASCAGRRWYGVVGVEIFLGKQRHLLGAEMHEFLGDEVGSGAVADVTSARLAVQAVHDALEQRMAGTSADDRGSNETRSLVAEEHLLLEQRVERAQDLDIGVEIDAAIGVECSAANIICNEGIFPCLQGRLGIGTLPEATAFVPDPEFVIGKGPFPGRKAGFADFSQAAASILAIVNDFGILPSDAMTTEPHSVFKQTTFVILLKLRKPDWILSNTRLAWPACAPHNP